MSTQDNKSTAFKLTVLLILIGAVVFTYYTYQTLAGTTLNKTLTTQTDLENGLVGHWTFDGKELIDNVTDRSTQGNDSFLTDFTSTTTATGKIGQGLKFDGIANYTTTANIPEIQGNSQDLSFSVWVRPDSMSGFEWIMSQWSGNNGPAMFRNGALIYWQVGGSTPRVTSSSLVLGEWTHIVGLNEGGTVKLYVNSVLASFLTTTVANTTSVSFDMGGPTEGGVGYLDGTLDDVRVYDRALSQDEITRLYNLGATTRINKTLTTNPDLESGLVGHWTFDGPDLLQSATDRSGQGNNGFLTNFTSTTTVRGKIGQALDFDGSDDFVNTRNIGSSIFSGDFAFSAWVKQDADAVEYIFGKGSGDTARVDLFTRAGTTFNFRFNQGSGQDIQSDSYTPAAWHHVVVTRDGTTLGIYVDGAFDKEVGNSQDGSTSSDLYLGDTSEPGDKGAIPWTGALDDVRIYNRALSAGEVKRLYNLGATTKINKTLTTNPDLESGLVGHWTFDGPDLLQNATDRSGQGNNGFLTNFTSTTTVRGKIGQALDFGGVNAYVDVGDVIPIETYAGATLAFWMKLPSVLTTTEYLAGVQDSSGTRYSFACVYYGGNSPKEVTCWTKNSAGTQVNSDAENALAFSDTDWHYISMTYDKSNVRYFLDGVETGSDPMTGDIDNPDAGFVIGRDKATSARDYSGILDDVRIYNRALSADEIKSLYLMNMN